MSKFVGKTTNYGNKESIIKSDKKENIIDSYFKEEDVIKLSKTPILDFSDDLQTTINSGTPMFLWSKTRQNNKIRLDNDKQVLILEKIQNLRAVNRELHLLKADDIFSEEFVLNLVAEKRMEAEQIFQAAVARHQLVLAELKTNIILTNSQVDHDHIEKQRKIKLNTGIDADTEIKLAQAEKIRAEAKKIKASNKESKKRIAIIEKILNEADFNHLTTQQTFLLHSFLGADPTQFSEFELREQLKEIIIQERKAEANKKEAEADDAKNKASHNKWKNDTTQSAVKPDDKV